MDIRKINGGSIIQKYEDKAKEVNIKKTGVADVREAKDRISISGDAKNVNISNIAVRMIKDDSQKEFAVDKLNNIREKIKNGAYDVSSDKIAKAVLSGIYAE